MFGMGLSPSAMAWGPRGHFAICEVAVDLVENKELKEFLKSKRHMMGHVCNIPDAYWKDMDYKLTSVGNPGHHINPENLNKSLENLDANFKTIATEFKISPYELNHLLGSLWWRTDQFYRLALDAAKEIQSMPRESKSKKNNRKKESPYIETVFRMMTNMALMGHFVGDSSMPYHNSSNFDGWINGRGGIHGYYESRIVDEFDFDFIEKVFEHAKVLKMPIVKDTKNYVVERMRTMSILGRDDIVKVEKVDIVLNPSSKEEGEQQIKSRYLKDRKKPNDAQRPDPKEMVQKFEPLVLEQMARSCKTIAELWDRLYIEAGKPSLKEYASYKFPFEPEFVWPDYL
jgi:hypothetical protein